MTQGAKGVLQNDPSAGEEKGGKSRIGRENQSSNILHINPAD